MVGWKREGGDKDKLEAEPIRGLAKLNRSVAYLNLGVRAVRTAACHKVGRWFESGQAI
jgi:hypothetical protein